jgi:nitroreductase
MVRDFDDRPVPLDVLASLVDTARRAPSAGNSQGWDLVVLQGPETAAFWDITLPLERRASFRWQGLLHAPVIALPYAHADAYLARYAEPDKIATGLKDRDAWPVPYWLVDTSFFTMSLLLAATNAGLGSLFFGVFRGEAELAVALGVPADRQLIGAIALGYPVASDKGRSAARPKRTVEDVLHLGRWAHVGEAISD